MFYEIVICIVLSIFTDHAQATDCFKRPLFSTKTPYNYVGNNLTQNNTPKGCKPIQINMVHRHGNRYPSDKDIEAMDDLLKLLRDKTSPNVTIPSKNPFRKEQDSLLNEVGEKELYGIGSRIRIRFSDLLQERYSPLSYKFESTCKLRCVHSSNSLAAGLFEGSGSLGPCHLQPIAIQTFPCDSSKELEFYDMCQNYIINVDKNKNAKIEVKKFGKGKEMMVVLEKVKRKLGLTTTTLEVKHLEIMYIYCAYELGMFNGSMETGFCSLFDFEDLYVIEYYYDLEDFYLTSNVYPITYQSSCPLLADIVKTLKDAKTSNGKNSFKGIFRSGHSNTIVPFLALLGVYLNEGNLTASNFAQMKDRKFRAACLAPFSANIYFVLYKCDDGSHKIQLSVNEQLVKVPCCESEYECRFEDFLKCYEQIATNCDFDDMCKVSNSWRLLSNNWRLLQVYFWYLVLRLIM